jgi:aminoglycoside/choline kinase family phosphotransferase
MTRSEHIQSCLSGCGFDSATLIPLAGDASFRRYIRITQAEKKALLMDAPPDKENVHSYMAIATYLYQAGYSAPQLLGADAKAGLVLIEDLGDDTYTRVLKRDATKEQMLYEAAVDILCEWHSGTRGFSNPAQLPLPSYDEALLMREVQLLADWYMPQVLGMHKARELQPEFMELWRQAIAASPLASDQFVHRDYHADNLMWLSERAGVKKVGLLDFQDGVYGDAAYDMVSLLEDARRDVPLALTQSMLARYVATTRTDQQRFLAAYALLGAQRNCKIVGIFARLAARDGKSQYLSYLPRVWGHLERNLAHPSLNSLATWMNMHIKREWRGEIALRHTAQELALTA